MNYLFTSLSVFLGVLLSQIVFELLKTSRTSLRKIKEIINSQKATSIMSPLAKQKSEQELQTLTNNNDL